jgi:flavin-dependent dehydrogenase
VDPLTREGIYYALRSGDLLAEAIAAGDPRSYAAAWEREAGRELAWAASHGGAFFRARFIERLVALCSASGAIARVLSDLIAGRQPYRTLRARLILNAPRVGWDILTGLSRARDS